MRFKKYVATGNDFIVFREEDVIDLNYSCLAAKVCQRRFGIGADGILIACESSFADVKMLYYNSDGTEGEMCGNGLRVFTKFIYDNNIVKKSSITVETLDGVKHIHTKIENNDIQLIDISMGEAVFDSKKVPIVWDKNEVINELIDVAGKSYRFSALRMGVPHVVIFEEDVDLSKIDKVGSTIEGHSIFPERTNVNFVERVNRNYIRVYTWERGAGRTLGCGTGCCSSVVVGRKLGILDDKVDVKTEGGMLQVILSEENVVLRGKATLVAEGEYDYANK